MGTTHHAMTDAQLELIIEVLNGILINWQKDYEDTENHNAALSREINADYKRLVTDFKDMEADHLGELGDALSLMHEKEWRSPLKSKEEIETLKGALNNLEALKKDIIS